MNRLYLLFFIALLLTGCSTMSDELATKEKLLVTSGQNEQLIEFYKSNLSNVPDYKVKLIDLYINKKDKKSAELYVNTYSKNDLNKSEVILTLAKLEYIKANYLASKKYLDEFLNNGGNKGQFYLLNGKILAQQKMYDLSIESFNSSKKNGASDREANNNIAVVKMLQGEHEQAMELLYKLFASEPNDLKVRSNLMLSAIRAKRSDIALDVLKYNNSEQEARLQLAKLISTIEPIPKRKTTLRTKNGKKKNGNKKEGGKAMVSNVVNEKFKKISVQSSKLDINSFKSKIPSIYRIQVLATYKVIPSDYLNYLKSNYGKVYSYTHGLWKRYCIGEFDNIKDAKLFMDNMNIKGIFVVDYTKSRFLEL